MMLTLIIFICSYIQTRALTKLGYGYDDWFFWVNFVCYSVPCIYAMIREWQLLNATEIAKKKAQRKKLRAEKRELKKFHDGVGFPLDRLKLKAKLNNIEREFQEEIRETIVEEFDLPKGFYNNED